MAFCPVLRADLRRAYAMLDGGRLRRLAGCARAPGVQAVTVYRFGQWLADRSLPVRLLLEPAYFVLNGLVKMLWGIELPRRARICATFSKPIRR